MDHGCPLRSPGGDAAASLSHFDASVEWLDATSTEHTKTKGGARMPGWIWVSVQRVIARNRAVALALLSAVASVLMGLSVMPAPASPAALQSGPNLAGVPLPCVAFAAAVALIVLTGAIPHEYEVADRLDFVLPAIYHMVESRREPATG